MDREIAAELLLLAAGVAPVIAGLLAWRIVARARETGARIVALAEVRALEIELAAATRARRLVQAAEGWARRRGVAPDR